MDAEIIAGFIVCFLVGLGSIGLGWLIWKKEYLHLISGFNASTFKGDKQLLARTVGLFMYIVGGLAILLPFGLEFIGEWVGILFGVVVIIGSTWVIIAANKR
ncbi:DUF3784 domain-containing protein [Solibacillus sp. FSL H8-0538]|uniref:DUF3784 domain-containing protein n=1 Tax=Solibacillus sp. FSL H8-0538 TaxID=2921400 RepID=UPI0030FB4396